MSAAEEKIPVSAGVMKSELVRILIKAGFKHERAEQCAGVFTTNSLEGVYSHGVNRFPRFVEFIKKGYVKPDAEPSCTKKFGCVEQWDGNLGPGPLNAILATEKVIEIAGNEGTGIIAMRNTNHWMRGGTYGWLAARKGYAFFGWSNTEANMPAWGGKDFRLGNNPLVIAIPFGNEAVVLDFAMSQYSYGKLETYQMEGLELPFPGGYNSQGELTLNPGEILSSRRLLPIGYWKGSGLALMLDILASSLSGGLSTHEVSFRGAEYGLSQVFIAVCLHKLAPQRDLQNAIEGIIRNIKESLPVEPGTKIRYPGENSIRIRNENLEKGIPVNKKLWDKILAL